MIVRVLTWLRKPARHEHEWKATPSIAGWTLLECECGEVGIA